MLNAHVTDLTESPFLVALHINNDLTGREALPKNDELSDFKYPTRITFNSDMNSFKTWPIPSLVFVEFVKSMPIPRNPPYFGSNSHLGKLAYCRIWWKMMIIISIIYFGR